MYVWGEIVKHVLEHSHLVCLRPWGSYYFRKLSFGNTKLQTKRQEKMCRLSIRWTIGPCVEYKQFGVQLITTAYATHNLHVENTNSYTDSKCRLSCWIRSACREERQGHHLPHSSFRMLARWGRGLIMKHRICLLWINRAHTVRIEITHTHKHAHKHEHDMRSSDASQHTYICTSSPFSAWKYSVAQHFPECAFAKSLIVSVLYRSCVVQDFNYKY